MLKLSGIKVTQGVQWVHLDDLHSAFARYGVSRRAFSTLLTNLCVPKITLTDSTTLVDMWAFAIALRHISGIGRPDFVFPGAKVLSRGREAREGLARTLDPEAFTKSHASVVREMLAAAEFNGHTSIANFSTLVEAAAARMAADATTYLRRELAGKTPSPRKAAMNERRDPSTDEPDFSDPTVGAPQPVVGGEGGEQ